MTHSLCPLGCTVLIDGYQLTSAVDRIAEARLQAQAIPIDAPEAWVYGCGLGDLVRVLLERPALRRLHVVVFNLEILEMARLVNDDRVRLYLPGTAPPKVRDPFAVCPGDLRHAEPAAYEIRDIRRTGRA